MEAAALAVLRAICVPSAQRGRELVVVMLAMVIAKLQGTWTLFTKPLQVSCGWSLVAVQVIFGYFGLTSARCLRASPRSRARSSLALC